MHASVTRAERMRSIRRAMTGASAGGGWASIHSHRWVMMRSTPGSRSAAALPCGLVRYTTRAWAATARTAGPVSRTSPTLSSRASRIRRARPFLSVGRTSARSGLEVGFESAVDAAQPAGDLDLAGADAPGDLVLGQTLIEAQVHDALIVFGESGEGQAHGDPTGVETVVVDHRQPPLTGVVTIGRGRQRLHAVRLTGLQGGQHVVLADLEVAGQFGHRGGAPQALTEGLHRCAQAPEQVRRPPRHPHRPGGVAEVAFDLAQHGGHGEPGETDPETGVVAVDGFEHAQLRHLHQVIEGFAPPGEPTGAIRRQPPVLQQQLVAQRPITRLPIPHQTGLNVVGFLVWTPPRRAGTSRGAHAIPPFPGAAAGDPLLGWFDQTLIRF